MARYRGCPLPKYEFNVNTQSELLPSNPENEDNEVGNNNKADANIGGITPGTLIFRGKCEESPANILFPICLFGYWTIIFLCDRSMKTIKIITAIARIKMPIIKNVDIEPVLPCSKIWAIALGSSATIPAKIINYTPLPIPREVICSPNQSRNITEPTKVTTVVILKKTPGLFTSDPEDPEVLSNATAKP